MGLKQMTHDRDALPFRRDVSGAHEQGDSNGYADSSVFEESELKRMRDVLQDVCSTLGIAEDSASARTAALAILQHTSLGATDADAIKQAVIEQLQGATPQSVA